MEGLESSPSVVNVNYNFMLVTTLIEVVDEKESYRKNLLTGCVLPFK